MEPNTIAILTSNDIQHTNADDVMGFAQNNDLFYLSGIDQEETILVLYPDANKEENRAILFIKETNEHIRTINFLKTNIDSLIVFRQLLSNTPSHVNGNKLQAFSLAK